MDLIDIGNGLKKGLLDPFDFNSWFIANDHWWAEFRKLRANRSSISTHEMRELMQQADLALQQQRNAG